jgi:hypothetical protein
MYILTSITERTTLTKKKDFFENVRFNLSTNKYTTITERTTLTKKKDFFENVRIHLSTNKYTTIIKRTTLTNKKDFFEKSDGQTFHLLFFVEHNIP